MAGNKKHLKESYEIWHTHLEESNLPHDSFAGPIVKPPSATFSSKWDFLLRISFNTIWGRLHKHSR